MREQTAGAPALLPLSEVCLGGGGSHTTGIGELDRVLGGGLVPGSAVLVAGEPGIGKSTLLLQACRGAPRALYVCGEETPEQVRTRADRLGVAGAIWCAPTTDVDAVLAAIGEVSPDVVVVDSVQTLTRSGVTGGPGSVGQVRECASALVRATKVRGIARFLVGQATKDGSVAGPRMLEHLVDTVLWFEGEPHGTLRLLRTTKNRFGPAHEVACFSMGSCGLEEVTDPSRAFAGDLDRAAPGVAVVPSSEGTRPMLVEVQALVGASPVASPRRTASGIDDRRLAVILAVLERHGGLVLGDRDVFVAAAGGVRLSEPAADLAVALAVASASSQRALSPRTAAVGEIGLTGEVRPVAGLERRITEAARLGFERVLVPLGAAPRASEVHLVPVRDVAHALDSGMPRVRRNGNRHGTGPPS